MPSFDLPKAVRLLKSAEFDRVFRRRCAASDDFIVVYGERGDYECPRLGLVVSRKCGNAVARNRWKRALREAFRLTQHELPRNLELVVLPRVGAQPDVARLRTSFRQLAKRLSKKLESAEGTSRPT